ncbi:polyphosphate:AMP phosphotransferase, partial [gut metagenome]
MLEKLDMSKKISKDEYNKAMDELELRLGWVQRRARDAKKPVIIIFEGWRGARRSTLINKMMQCMDARGFDVYSTVGMAENNDYPFFTFFWQKLPAKGHIAVYHRSWYYLKNANEVQGDKRHGDDIGYTYINSFEKMLTDDNYIILKYFLHLTPEQQKKNLAKHSKSLGKAWRDLCPAIDETGHYDEFLERYEKMLGETDTVNAPWHLIAADDGRNAQLEVFRSIVETVERVLEAPEVEVPAIRPAASYDVLSKVQPEQEMSKEEYKDKLEKYQKKLSQLQVDMFRAQIP